jgi:hypothetical protein
MLQLTYLVARFLLGIDTSPVDNLAICLSSFSRFAVVTSPLSLSLPRPIPFVGRLPILNGVLEGLLNQLGVLHVSLFYLMMYVFNTVLLKGILLMGVSLLYSVSLSCPPASNFVLSVPCWCCLTATLAGTAKSKVRKRKAYLD